MVSEDYNRVNDHSVDESLTVDGTRLADYYNDIQTVDIYKLSYADPSLSFE